MFLFYLLMYGLLFHKSDYLLKQRVPKIKNLNKLNYIDKLTNWIRIKDISKDIDFYEKLTDQGNILCLSRNNFHLIPMINQLEDKFNVIDLVDSCKIIEEVNHTPFFNCFITNIESSVGIVTRIDNTNIWILVSEYTNLEYNKLDNNLTYSKFIDIQNGFVELINSTQDSFYY